jgi:endonuclease/exonuclease/phosphatase family metal-dependent hydrolase
MEWFPGGQPEAKPPEVVDQISKVVPALENLAPDILGASEILNEKALEIALYKTNGAHAQVCSAFSDETGVITPQQIGIASNLPAQNAWWESWKPAKVTPKRGFSFAAFTPSPGVVLLVYAVHLKSNRGNEAENFAMREESAKQILAHVADMEKVYANSGRVAVLIGGDSNTSLDDPKFARESTLRDLKKAGFTWCWENIPFEDRITLPTAPSKNPALPPFPDTCFDHVFAKGLNFKSAAVASVPHNPSDHRPVIVEFEFPWPTKTP